MSTEARYINLLISDSLGESYLSVIFNLSFLKQKQILIYKLTFVQVIVFAELEGPQICKFFLFYKYLSAYSGLGPKDTKWARNTKRYGGIYSSGEVRQSMCK